MRFLALLLLTGCSTLSHPFLYSAEKEGRKIILLGTIHTGVPVRDLPGRVYQEMKASKAVFLETDFVDYQRALDANDDEELARRIFRETYFRDEGSSIRDPEPKLSERLSPAVWRKLAARLSRYSPKFLDELKPAGALIYLGPIGEEQLTSYEANALNPAYGMDYRLYGWAKDLGIRTIALDKERHVCEEELMRSHIKSIELALDGKLARGTLDSLWKKVDAYREGDEGKVLALDSEQEYVKVDQCLIGRRNREWIDLIEHYPLRGEQIFVAAGLMHLLSKTYPNLPDLLRERGFKVERIMP